MSVEHVEPCETIKTVETRVMELTERIKNMSTWVRWTGTTVILVVGTVLGFLIETDARTNDKMDSHTADMIAHRTAREIEEMQKNETIRFEYLKKELYELRRGQAYIKGRQK
jgi:hypothetical protein